MEDETTEMRNLSLAVDDSFAALNIFKILSDPEQFKIWLKEEFDITTYEDHFEGYKFFLETAIYSFINSINYNSSLPIKEDFIFYRSKFVGIELSKTPNSCDKVIFLKRINLHLKQIKKSQTWEQIKIATNNFQKEVGGVFNEILEKYVEATETVQRDKQIAIIYATMVHTLIFFNDTRRGLPWGYYLTREGTLPPGKIKNSFKGYKYCLQYLWKKMLGEKYYDSKIRQLYKCKKWTDEENAFTEKILSGKKGKTKENKNLEKTESLDDYFKIVNNEIIKPIEKDLKNSLHLKGLLIPNKKIPKNIFNNLLKPLNEPQLTAEELLTSKLLWYQIELLDSHEIFNGVPAFINSLMGVVEQKRIFSKGDKAYVVKFIHPQDDLGEKNDYSYGVLIESHGTLADYSGWLIFFDCCGDYSGFSGSMHALSEGIIDRYRGKKAINLIEIKISKEDFNKYLVHKITPRKGENIKETLSETSLFRREKEALREAQGLLVELLTYYTLTRHSSKEKEIIDIDWNVTTNKENIDLVIETTNQITLIECINNSDNYSFKEFNNEIIKLSKKADLYSEKKKKIEFWFWKKPSKTIINLLTERNVKYKVLSDLIFEDPAWQNKKRDKFRTIFFSKNKILEQLGLPY